MKKYDYLIVGCGIAGIVLAQSLSVKGKTTLMIDSRDHIGGNCYDCVDEFGVLVHKYGPHYFRTDSDEVFAYLSQFTEWHHHDYKVKAQIGEKLYTFPINLNTFREFFDQEFDEQSARDFLETKRDRSIEIPKNAEEQILSTVGRDIYEAFFQGYTEKQWGVNVTELAPSVTARIPIRFNIDDRYVLGKFQALPKQGYTKMFEKMLEHKNITLQLSTPFEKHMLGLAQKTIWTGQIDQFFEYRLGHLPYRSLRFEFEHYQQDYLQPCEQINFPEKSIPWTRTVEIKHVTGQKIAGTTISREFPMSSGDPYYPIPADKNHFLYKKYEELAQSEKNVIFIGRLARYKYMNMDEVVADCLKTFCDLKD